MNQNALMNAKQLAEYLQLKPGTLYTWAQKGKLPAIKVGRNWRFRKEEIDTWLDANSRGPMTRQPGKRAMLPDKD